MEGKSCFRPERKNENREPKWRGVVGDRLVRLRRLVCCRRFPLESKRQHVYCRSAPHSVLAVRLRRPVPSRPTPPFFLSQRSLLPSFRVSSSSPSALPYPLQEYPFPLLLSSCLTNPIQFREEKRWQRSPSIWKAQFGRGGKLEI